jgi:FlaA1/EpsC-like NDP-sugar epimerase
MLSPNHLSYESILGRSVRPAFFNSPEINRLQQEKFLITGAGGSIGSKIVSLVSSLPGAKFLATDRDESSLHSLSLSLTTSALFDSDNFELLDIRDQQGIDECFSRFQPSTVIHAAALKHLSALERQPREAILTNVFGSANLLEAAVRHNVRSFINISTDKAASPTSVLGLTKHLAEIYTSKLRSEGYPGYTNCRFGNVFNSRGSVIETFFRQMQIGAPITLTEESVKRFFMHVDEAAYLTLKSLIINSGDVHIFRMGEAVLMIDIIRRMQKILSSESQILITGLRSGEKLNEILLEDGMNHVVTENPDIIVMKFPRPYLEKSEKVIGDIINRDFNPIKEFISEQLPG